MLTSESSGRPAVVGGLTGKDKAARVPLDYFRRTSKTKVVAALAGLGVVGVALLASLASGYWRELASPGPVHSVHAAWEHDCSVCHEPLQPTSSRNGLQRTMGTGPVSDALCRKCHAGPPHHPSSEIEGDPGTCASCHADHRGRNALLSKPPDSSCARCHKDLGEHVREGSPEYTPKITRFDRDHPQFKLGPAKNRQPLGEARDPGKSKFNHAAHLTAGIRYSERDAGGWTLGHIKDGQLRERYRKQNGGQDKDQDLVQLACASCHQLDATDAPKAGPGQNLPLRTRGEYMLPTTYEQHCKACHPLTFDPALPDVEVPHLLQPPEVRDFLWGVFAGQEVKSLQKNLKKGRPMPGANLGREEKEARDRIKSLSGDVEKFLFQEDLGRAGQFVFKGKTTCGLCHEYGGSPGAKTPEKILPTDVPQVWYPHGKFSHRAHRAAQCVACHAGAEKSTKSTDVLLPGIENCRTCHAPAAMLAGNKRGGVRYDCTTCHRYHLGERPMAGLGVNARGVKERRTLQEFLDGK